MSTKIVKENFEAVKKDYLETEMTLDEIGRKWQSNRYTLSRLFKLHGIKRPYRQNLLGKRFGKLRVVQFLGSQDGSGLWKCICDCGNTKEIITKILNYGEVNSCGCLQKTWAKEHIKSLHKPLDEKSLANWVFILYKHGAKRRLLPFDLSLENCLTLFKSPCHYCGAPPSQFKTNKTKEFKFYYNGIDRMDNERGYVSGNVVSCCKHCNIGKGQKTTKEFLTWIANVYKLSIK